MATGTGVLESFYHGNDKRSKAIFRGIDYRPPEVFEHGKDYDVATLQKTNGDGQTCVITESRYPARFFGIRVEAGTNSVGKEQPAYEVSSGSGDDVGKLIVQMAKAISEGMLGFHPCPRT